MFTSGYCQSAAAAAAARQHLLYEPFLVTKRLCTIAITAMTMATDGARLAGVGRPSVYVVFVLPGHRAQTAPVCTTDGGATAEFKFTSKPVPRGRHGRHVT